jgi:hypothetical protein
MIQKINNFFKELISTVNLNKSLNNYYLENKDGSIITRLGNKKIIVEKNGKVFKDVYGRNQFEDCSRYEDGSTRTKDRDIEIITEKNGSIFKNVVGMIEFDDCSRFKDGSTETRVGDKYIITKKDGSIFKDKCGRVEFDISRKKVE